MQQQLLLGMEHPKRYENELVYGASNADVYDWMARYHEWPLKQTMIVGPEKSGKTGFTHLLAKQWGLLRLDARMENTYPPPQRHKDQLFLNFSGKKSPFQLPAPSALPLQDVVLDNADDAPQEWLFHLINHQKLAQKHLVLTSTYAPAIWHFDTQDIASRIKAFYVLRIQDMDDALCERLLKKLLLERGIQWDSQAIDYLMKRAPRDYQELFQHVNAMDRFLLGAHKRLSAVQARHFYERFHIH